MFEEDAICVRGCGVKPDAVCDETCPLSTRVQVRIDLLITSHGQQFVWLAMSFGNSKEEAEDIVQEAFVRAYRSFPRWHGTSANLVHWLRRITTNLAIDARKLRNRSSCSSLEVLGEMADTAANPETHALASFETERINIALGQLREPYAQAIKLRLDGFSYEDIANLCGVPRGTAGRRIHTGWQMLRDLLKENEDAL